MADQVLRLIISADSRAATKELRGMKKDLQGISDTTGKMATGFAIAGAAVAGSLIFMASKAGEAQLAHEKLLNTIANNASLATVGVEAFEDQAAAIQMVTAADDEAVLSADALLGQFGLTGQQVRELTPLVVDLSRKLGGDMDAAAKAVGKAMNGTVGGLQRAGIFVDQTTYKTDRLAAVTDALRKTVGGFAEQELKTLPGALAALQNQMSDFMEGAGSPLAEMFAQYAVSLARAVAGLNEWMKLHPELVRVVATASIGMAAFLLITAGVLKVVALLTAAKAALIGVYLKGNLAVLSAIAVKSGEITVTEGLTLATGQLGTAIIATTATVAGIVAGLIILAEAYRKCAPAATDYAKAAEEANEQSITTGEALAAPISSAAYAWELARDAAAKYNDTGKESITVWDKLKNPISTVMYYMNVWGGATNATAESTATLTERTTALADATNGLTQATKGYTDELIYQNNYLSAADTARQTALEDKIAVKRAQEALNTAIKKYGKNSDEARLARINLTEAERKAKDSKNVAKEAAAGVHELETAWRQAAGGLGKYLAKVGYLSPKERKSVISAFLHDPGYALGGIASGPASGYTATLHGTEAILPLNNPRRYVEVLAQANAKMGVPASGGDSYHITVHADSMSDRRAIAAAVDDVMSSYARNGRSLRAGGAFA